MSVTEVSSSLSIWVRTKKINFNKNNSKGQNTRKRLKSFVGSISFVLVDYKAEQLGKRIKKPTNVFVASLVLIMIKSFILAFLFFESLAFSEYYSQYGQDKFVNETFFKNSRNGVFVDIGAHDGISLSNTYFFEKELEWTGICLEPIPHVFNQLQKNRACVCICGCISTDGHNSMQPFLQISGYPEMLSGLIDKFDPKHLSRILYEVQEYGGSYQIIDVPCYNLNQILEDVGINHVNFLSLDTEGGEFEILQNFDFSKCQIDVITVEDNYRIHPFISLLLDKGFEFITALNKDLIFVDKNLLKN